MGIGNSSSSSSTPTSNTDNSKSFSVGDSSTGKTVGQSLSFMDTNGGTFNLLDGGALQAAKEIAMSSLNLGGESLAMGNAGLAKAMDETFRLAQTAKQSDTQSVLGSLTKFAWIGGGAAVLLGGFWFLSKKGAA